MPRFYFDVFDGTHVLADEFGDEFASEQEAAKQAIELVPALTNDGLAKSYNLNVVVSLRNHYGQIIFRSISATRSQWPNRDDYSYNIKIGGYDCAISHSRKLRSEARELLARLQFDVLDLVTIVESAAATLDVSRRILRGEEP